MNRRQKRILTAAMMAAFSVSVCPLTGQAAMQEAMMDEYTIEDIIVTATRTPVEGARADANVTVVTAEQIERNHYTDVTELLRDVPGVTVNQYGLAGYNHSNGLYINGSNDVVILIDGVKQNYAGGTGGGLSSALKNLDNIERIEVMRGSASTLYGSDAKGGVINIITKKAARLKTTLHAAYGSYSRQQYSVANEGRADAFDWRVRYQKDKSGDFSDAHGDTTPSELDANSLDVHVGYDLGKGSDIALNFYSYKDSNQWSGLYEHRKGDPPGEGEVNTFSGNLIWNAQMGDTVKNQLVLSRGKYFYRLERGWKSKLEVWNWKVSDQLDVRVGDHLWTAGFEFTQDATKTLVNAPNLLNRSYYIQDQWRIAPEVKLTAGIRHDSNSAFGSHNSPSVSIGYDIDPRTHFFASYSEYFIAPTPTQLYGPFGANPKLKPERGFTKEVGLNHDFGDGLFISAHYFQRQSDDRIGYKWPFGYINVGDEGANGWDLQVTKRFDEHFATRLSYTRLNVTETEAREANVDGYLPVGQWHIGLDYTNRAFDASLSARGVIDRPGPRKDPIGNFFPTKTYWVYDLALNYHVTPEAKVYLKVNNLFNQFYAEHSNARASWWGAAEEWWTAPGRNFMLGVEYNF